MKIFKVILTAILIIVSVIPCVYSEDDICVSAEAAVLMAADTGEILFSKNKDKKMSMASTTKIMTSLIALESGKQKNTITVKAEDIAVEGTSMGLLDGDKVTLETLVYGMLLPSGNDAANVTAKYLSGKTDFITKMNLRAKQIGMNNTSFATPSGLDNESHYSTAYDMALLAKTAIKNPEFRYICSQSKISCVYGNPPYRRMLFNHNRLLRELDGCIGIKTGFTKKSGRCLVTAAERNNITLVAVTLNAPDDWNDHKRLYEYGFSRVNKTNETALKNLCVVGGKKNFVPLKIDDAKLPATANTNEITEKIFVKRFEYAPVRTGQIVGYALYYYKDRLIKTASVITASGVRRKV